MSKYMKYSRPVCEHLQSLMLFSSLFFIEPYTWKSQGDRSGLKEGVFKPPTWISGEVTS